MVVSHEKARLEGEAGVRTSEHVPSSVPFKGVHHLALNTDEIKTTIDFYTGVVGMRLVHAMRVPPGISRGNPPFERIRHYFFDMGNDSLLAFFELPKGAKEQADRDGVAAMQHVSFASTEAEVAKLVERLDAAGVQRAGPLEAAPGCWSVYFYDPHGVRLEVSYQPAQGDCTAGCRPFPADARKDAGRTVDRFARRCLAGPGHGSPSRLNRCDPVQPVAAGGASRAPLAKANISRYHCSSL